LQRLCAEVLREHRDRQQQEREAAGQTWSETDLVFATSAGTELDAANARRDFRRALQKVPGMDPVAWTPRELRHSFVSVMSNAGVPLEEIARLVGHSGTSVTETVYRHELRPVMQTGAAVLDQLFSPSASGPGVTPPVTPRTAKSGEPEQKP
jgi:integrase